MLDTILKISLVIFMFGNMLDLGLRLDLPKALQGLRDVRFVILTLVWGYIVYPALGYLMAKTLPLSPGYAMALILVAMAPGNPFLAVSVSKARGDVNYAASFMLLASAVTVVYMPFMVPVLVKGLSATPWMIAKPMLVFILLPMVLGAIFRLRWESGAAKVQPFVKKATGLATLVMIILLLVIYGKGLISSVGTFALGSQVGLVAVIAVAAYWLGFGLSKPQKQILVLGLCARNVGAALAPLFIAPNVDPDATMATGALGTLVVIGGGLAVASLFARQAGKTDARDEAMSNTRPAPVGSKGERP
jgi:BASS family bile acid:Na+ symporter